MDKRGFRRRALGAPAYPLLADKAALRTLAAIGAAVALAGGLAACGGLALPPDSALDAGDPRQQDVSGGATLPDAGTEAPDAGQQ